MPYKLKRRGKTVWRGQARIGEKTIQRQFSTKKEAQDWELNHDQPQPTVTRSVSLLGWATEYLAYCVRYASKTTNDKANVFRRLFASVSHETQAGAFDRKQALTFLQAQFQGRSGYAANKDRKNLAAAWAWGADYLEGFPAINPFKLVRKFPEAREPRYVPTEADFWTVADAATGQDRVLLLSMLYLAARKGEVYRLTWADVDFSRSQVRLTTRKRQDGSMEEEWVPMVGELYDVLLAHRQVARNEWVFTQTVGRHDGKPYTENRGFPQELCREVKVKPFGCHAIRHLTASILARADVPMVVIQGILRHKKLSTTERYVRRMETVRPYLECLSGGQKRTKSVPKMNPPKAVTSGGL
ncbi:integrase family protein [Solidesulfovibrio carbinoliphilus subsp. oakridgensis]|uniref:Integrase family protein n=1 Tax=Solidesulfovibrio carbinoliphilus subsp. oakridgensis TaxID=694327 RepID=G7Q5L5_9BACT|nr:tyrosine-type recombinase/integrase [Solidesulfovibrio carbinoliphilus]EHJ49574.1 integrase family protein [Solidesulfovibrio carbinoliphilus subsp. oakridgensis]